MFQWWKESGALYSQIVAKSWADDAFAHTFIAHPRKVLADHGITVPEGVQVKVVAGETDLVVRADPPPGTLELPLPGRPADLDQASLQKVLKYWPGYDIFC
jgi:hypothetical protein